MLRVFAFIPSLSSFLHRCADFVPLFLLVYCKPPMNNLAVYFQSRQARELCLGSVYLAFFDFPGVGFPC